MIAVVGVDDVLAQTSEDPANPAPVRAGPHMAAKAASCAAADMRLVAVLFAPRAHAPSSRQRSWSAAMTTSISSGLA